MSTNLDQIVEQLSTLTVMEAAELSKRLEEKWGVSAAPVAVAAVAGAAASAPAEEKSEFSVVLVDAGAQKLNVIKELRAVNPALGLVEAKNMVESLPKTIKEGASKDDAEKIKKQFEAAGAKVELK